MRIDAGADRRAALRERQQPRLHRREPRHAVLDLRAPARQLLPQRHRHGVHEMRAAGLDRVRELPLAPGEHVAQVRQRGSEAPVTASAALTWIAVGITSLLLWPMLT